MKKSEYEELISLLESVGYVVHMIGQDRYFLDRKDRLGISITASRPCTTDEKGHICDFCSKNNS